MGKKHGDSRAKPEWHVACEAARAMKLSLALASFAVIGCTSAAAPMPAPSGETTSPPAAPAECGDGEYRTSANTCEAFPKVGVVRSERVIAPARDHHTTMVIETASGPWLYVVGGTEGWSAMHDDVQRAKIAPDGSLGAFENAGKLPAPRAGHCMVKKGDRLYLFGGVTGTSSAGAGSSTVLLTLDADGKVVSSASGPELPTAVMHLTCDLVDDFVFVNGGRGKNSHSTTLSARTKIEADGSLSDFEKQTPLDPDRSHHASFVREKRLYIIGGLTGDPTATTVNHKDVVYADISEDGTLGTWTPAGALPKALSVSSATLYKDAVYIFGGLENGVTFTNRIRRATFELDGTLSAFATMPALLPEARGHVHQTPTYDRFLYSVGGKDDAEKSLDVVDIATFE